MLGDHDFIADVVSSSDIAFYYEHKWYPEAFYLLAMLDLVCVRNNVMLCPDYKGLRTMHLAETLYPDEVIALADSVNSDRPLYEARKTALPQFLQYNIVEFSIDQ